MNAVKSVFYNNGEAELFALVVADKGEHELDLIVFDQDTGASSLVRNVPRRAKADYGPEGGGRTWHA